MTTGQTPSTNEYYVIGLKAPAQLLNGPCGDVSLTKCTMPLHVILHCNQAFWGLPHRADLLENEALQLVLTHLLIYCSPTKPALRQPKGDASPWLEKYKANADVCYDILAALIRKSAKCSTVFISLCDLLMYPHTTAPMISYEKLFLVFWWFPTKVQQHVTHVSISAPVFSNELPSSQETT